MFVVVTLACWPVASATADTATYDDTPGSAESARLWAEITGAVDLPDVQMRGSLGRSVLVDVADHLVHVPLAVTQRADAVPKRNLLFSGRLTDLPWFTYLRGVKPTGWPDGYTWDTVSGVGAGAPGGGMAVNPTAENTRSGEGAFALSLHEYGHVLDSVYGPPTGLESSSAGWQGGPFAELQRVGAQGWVGTNAGYFLGNAGEWWAEAVDLYLVNPEQHAFLKATYPETWQYLADLLGVPRFDVHFGATQPTSNPNPQLSPSPPRGLSAPVLTGRPVVGSVLRCRPGRFSGATTITTSWLRGGRRISGAVGTSYTVKRRDRGRKLACRTQATNAAGARSALSRSVRIRR